MIEYTFEGEPYPSHDERERMRMSFEEKLGPFKEEFEQSEGYATLNANGDIYFGIKKGDQSDFIDRWNEYIRNL